eukprot:NODE_76_length_23341_cov_0.477498.p8 type:complete len:196 gc:universal NODE_76_length_23341_cov_0.477498:16568-17155(+)
MTFDYDDSFRKESLKRNLDRIREGIDDDVKIKKWAKKNVGDSYENCIFRLRKFLEYLEKSEYVDESQVERCKSLQKECHWACHDDNSWEQHYSFITNDNQEQLCGDLEDFLKDCGVYSSSNNCYDVSDKDSDISDLGYSFSNKLVMKDDICHYFQKGECKFEEKCKYLHITKPCVYFYNGKCRYGNQCKYSHTDL